VLLVGHCYGGNRELKPEIRRWLQLDALTEAKISVLRSKGAKQNPALLHDLTAATNASDYPF
jgi:hypothetical protein